MARILLINSPISRYRRDPNAELTVPPMGLGYLATQLRLAGHECDVIDAVAKAMLPEEVMQTVNQSEAELVGFNVFSSNLDIVHTIIRNAPAEKTILLGGAAIRTLISAIEAWRSPVRIVAVIGEADLLLPRIAANLHEYIYPSNPITALCIDSSSPYFPFDIDLPLDRRIFTNEPIIRADLGLVESHIIASRGCVYNCAFCTAARSLNGGSPPRFRSYESLLREVCEIKELYQETTSVRVLDDLFLRDPSSIDLAIRLFSEAGLGWRSMGHINTFRNLPEHVMANIKNSGCSELFIGIESGNDDTLKYIRKPFTSNVACKTVMKMLNAEIAVKCYFIMGFPNETEESLKDTYTLASKLQEYARRKGVPFRVSTFRFRPYHGTLLYAEAAKKANKMTIRNRSDYSTSEAFRPYDFVAGLYADCDEQTLEKYMQRMENLNAS